MISLIVSASRVVPSHRTAAIELLAHAEFRRKPPVGGTFPKVTFRPLIESVGRRAWNATRITDTPSNFNEMPRGLRAMQLYEGGQRANYFLKTFGSAARDSVNASETRLEPVPP